ncbi:two-component system chemotaxis response regulator CheY [Bacillus oleivorans]|uniref:Two-component system chemotaxis response regulator CheY n=1 Tax=Bacillus oleivorans TaxID=1448271 RepID=A0A285D843_9BACI|nr:response regulator [Bacillus oleivorans]SNX75448.1 two-component system chemotaxis response regulator CheY [Bacillus oleivorans]
MANILIVDDAKFMRMTLGQIFQEADHTVVGEAENGKEAIDRYIEFKPDLVTMDITMPEMDGIEAVKKIKDFDPKATIIMCSAIGQSRLVLEAIEAGAVDFIVKPFEKERVIEAVERALRHESSIS